MPKAFKISNDEISEKEWGDVDKSAIWQIFKQGFEEGADGVTAAIREMYAVVKAPINEELTAADCWGPHHEIRSDGTLVVNRRGVIAAVQALAGARVEPSLTQAEKVEAAKHLNKHYRALGLELPDSVKALVGEMEVVPLQADVNGEMAINDIPVAPWADIESLKEGDNSPMEVIVSVPVGKSKRGWLYTEEALRSIEKVVNEQGLPGFLGHQKPEEVEHEFPKPVTHWVGAKFENGKLYVRGVIDKDADDLKRWIKGRAVRTVSIFGVPKLAKKGNGEIEVVDYQPLSIDWTPLGRNGMPTEIVAVGEIDVIGKEADNVPVINEVAEKVYGELTALLGVEGEEVIEAVEEMKKVVEEQRKMKVEQLINKLVSEKVVGEIAQVFVKKLIKYDGEPDEEKISGEIDRILNDDEVKKVLETMYVTPAPVVGEQTVSKLAVKRVRI